MPENTTLEQLVEIHDELTDEALERQIDKAPEWSPRHDVLANYKKNKGIWGILYRLEDQIQEVRRYKKSDMIPKEQVKESVIDSINYLIAIWALIETEEELEEE